MRVLTMQVLDATGHKCLVGRLCVLCRSTLRDQRAVGDRQAEIGGSVGAVMNVLQAL